MEEEFNYFKGIDEQPTEGVFDNVIPTNEAPVTPALTNKTLILAMARVNTNKNPSLQMTEDAIQEARDIIDTGQEMTERNKIAANRALAQGASLNKLKMDGANFFTPEDSKQIDEAYRKVLTFDAQRKAQGAAEKQAIENIQTMAARDPVQAQVLLDNLQYGSATDVHNKTMMIQVHLLQRAEELDHENGQTGWGRTALNFTLSVIPANYNFSRTGVVAGADTGILDWVFSGEGLRKQSESLYNNLQNMDDDEIAAYLASNGPLMKSIRDNATTFGSFDPSAASDILGGVKGQSDDSRFYSNLWGGIEIAGAIPVGRIASLTKTIGRAGARTVKQQILANAADTLIKEGEEAAVKKTGVTIDELRAAQSTKHVDPSVNEEFAVSDSLDLAVREEASAKAAELLPETVREFRLSDPEDIVSAYEKLQDDLIADIARPLKDASHEVEITLGGNEVRYVEATVGNVRGTGGYAEKSTMKGALKSIGYEGKAFQAEDGQWYARVKMNMPEINGFQTSKLTAPTQGFLSTITRGFARSTARTTDTALHGKSSVAGSAINRMGKELDRLIQSAYKTLPRPSQEVVDQIALTGANNARWWKDGEFRELVQRGYGREATEAELQSYKDLQTLNKLDYGLRDSHERVQDIMAGYENAKFTAMGQEFDDIARVTRKPTIKPGDRIFNASDNVHYTSQNNPLTDAEFTRLVNNGYVLVEPKNAIELFDGTTTSKFLMKREDVISGEVKYNRLAYSEGGHRLYVHPAYVKQGSEGIQPDTGTKFLKAPRTFTTASNIAEARKWADTMNEARLAVKNGLVQTGQELDDLVFKGNTAFPSGNDFIENLNKGLIDKNHPFEAVYDRELPSLYRTSDVNIENFTNVDERGYNGYYRTTGKAFTSRKGDILLDTNGNIAPTIDPYEALSTSLRQLTRQVGLFNYKTEALDKFNRTFRDDLDDTSHLKSSFAKFDEATIKKDTPLERRNFINNQRFAIRNVLSYETPGERAARQSWRSAQEGILGSGDNALRVFGYNSMDWVREKNPVIALKNFVFDAKLGMFNIGQFFIQTSTMMSAMALSPKAGFQGMVSAVPLHFYLLKGGSETLLETYAKRGVGKMAGFKTEQEFKEYARYMRKTGFMDMNGSHTQIGGEGSAAHFGSFGEKVHAAREAGRVFFYSAEVYNRLVAFRIAWDEVAETGLKMNDPGFAGDLMRRSNDYSMNMAHESAAQWQKGIMSIPTQFWAYNARMMDAMFGNRFTGKQKAQLIGMNLLMAGAAGNMVTEGLSYFIHDKTGAAPDIDTMLGTIDRGVLDRMHYELTGADVRIGEKMGTGGWVRETLASAFGASQYGEKPFFETAGGASYSILKSVGGTVLDVFKYAAAESGGDMEGYNLTGDAYLKMFQEISTLGNISKAMLVHQAGIFKSNGGTVYDDIPPVDSLYIALGFRPQETATLGYRMNYLKNKDEFIKEASGQIFKWKQEAFFVPDKKEENFKKVNAFVKLLPDDSREKVLRTVGGRKENETLYDHIEKKYNLETGQVTPQAEDGTN